MMALKIVTGLVIWAAMVVGIAVFMEAAGDWDDRDLKDEGDDEDDDI